MRFVCVPDEESDDVDAALHRRARRRGPARRLRDHRRADRPAHRRPGQGRARRPRRTSAGIAAHGSTPWLGDNAILKAHDAFRRIETLPFSRESSDLFDRPSINLARIDGGDAFNKVPDRCTMDVDIRFLPDQDPERDPRADPRDRRPRGRQVLHPRAGDRRRADNPYVRALRDAVGRSIEGEALSVGRDGASDAISFLRGGHPGGRVRARRRRPPRPARVGLDRLAGALSRRRWATSSRGLPRGCERRGARAAAAGRRGRPGLSAAPSAAGAAPRTLSGSTGRASSTNPAAAAPRPRHAHALRAGRASRSRC